MSNTVIEVKNLCKDYGKGDIMVHALRDVSLTIERGDFVAIMGPSGSGKTTFMNTLGCLDRPTSGEYFLDGKNVAELNENELAEVRNKYIGFVFQQFNLLPRQSALRNVELPLQYAGVKNRHELAAAALEKVGLGQRMDHRPNELSGGQQQRVAVARAIVNNPVMILGDEPTGNLDSRTTEEILAIFQALNREGKTVIIVTHEEEVAHHCKRVIRFKDGRVVVDERIPNPVDSAEVLKTMPDPNAVTA
jgi:putative ABC transport system ATP-binding protein